MSLKHAILPALACALLSCVRSGDAGARFVSAGSGTDCAAYVDHGTKLLLAELDQEVQASLDLEPAERQHLLDAAHAEAKRQLDARRGRTIEACDRRLEPATYHCVMAARDMDGFRKCKPPDLEIGANPGVNCSKFYDHGIELALRYVDELDGMSNADRKSAHRKIAESLESGRSDGENECVTSLDKGTYDCFMSATTMEESRHCAPSDLVPFVGSSATP